MRIRLWQRIKKFKWPILLLIIAGALWYAFCLPSPLFNTSYSRVLEDSEGHLMGARVADDGQWRFPSSGKVPTRFAAALVRFEDKRFYRHPGVDPLALARAAKLNLQAGSVVSGGSTLSMQVIRLARGNPKRSLWNKALEIIQATRLELGYTKEEILAHYAAHAPFGGNVVGLEAACWRYYAKPPELLSWAESAALAVLPNSPGLIHPGLNRQELRTKRDRLLHILHQSGKIDSSTLELALEEPLPGAPQPLPDLAPHLLERTLPKGASGRVRASIDGRLQEQLNGLVDHHQRLLSRNGIHNAAVLVIDLEQNKVAAYIGNAPGAGGEHEGAVDLIRAERSTGSILKPFLFASALQEGSLLPQMLLPDIPTLIRGYRPENFYPDYDGCIPADKALIRSLNVPFVHLLRAYGHEKFHHRLRQLGLQGIRYSADHYGLTLILGGAESSLWDITNAYAGMARTLLHYYPYRGQYDPADYAPAGTEAAGDERKPHLQPSPELFSAASVWFTFRAMRQLERPNAEGQWERIGSGQQIAWKTGTSFGFRDAWAVGVSNRYAVGVWVGNADGEGRPGLIGVQAAAPILFDIIHRLPQGEGGYEEPHDELREVLVCKLSGQLAHSLCPSERKAIPKSGLRSAACPFHQKIFLETDSGLRAHAGCRPTDQILADTFFVLPPVQEYYWKRRHADYRQLPPWASGCQHALADSPMDLVYPAEGARIYLPRDLDGELSATIFSLAHRQPEALVHWHLDETYLGTTQVFHSLELRPEPGIHQLTLTDDAGHRLIRRFEIVPRSKQ